MLTVEQACRQVTALVPAWRSGHGGGAGGQRKCKTLLFVSPIQFVSLTQLYEGDWVVGGNADQSIRVAKLDRLPKLSVGVSHAPPSLALDY